MKKRTLFILAAALILSSCMSSKKDIPIGIGSATDEFSKSRCACMPAFYVDGLMVG